MPKLKENVTPQAAEPLLSSPMKDKYKEFLKEEQEMVRGRFRNFETPGGSNRIQIRKYKELPMFDKTMTDEEVYEVPLYVARHLNGIDITAGAIDGKVGSCSYVVHGFKSAPDGNLPPSSEGAGPSGQPGVPVPYVGVAKRVRRFGFESLEFDRQSL